MSKTTKTTLLIIIGLFILGIALYPTISQNIKKSETEDLKENSTPTQPTPSRRGGPLNVSIKVVHPEKLTDQAILFGNLLPDEEVNLAFESSGKITDIFFQEGSFVKKGVLLAKINDKPLQAELKKLEAQIPLARDRVFRQSALLEKDAVSQESYEQVTTEYEKLQADIELVKSKIAQTELRAPFDGMIGLRQVSEGSYVSPNSIIAVLTKISPLKIEFSFNEKHTDFIRKGTPIAFSSSFADGGNSDVYHAIVYAVESSVDLKTKTLKARAIYPNVQRTLFPGGSVNVQVNIYEINNALTVPNESVIAEMGRDILYLYSQGKAKQTEVTKGMRTKANLQILSGLHAGDTVITTGVMQLRDGSPVNIIN